MINGEIFVDNFAGGGGASTGIEIATGHSVDIAINHDPEAMLNDTPFLEYRSTENVDVFFDELYIKELEYSFTYRDISKEAMILLVETIAKGVGIQPYKYKEK